jgi:hypothetical protein
MKTHSDVNDGSDNLGHDTSMDGSGGRNSSHCILI